MIAETFLADAKVLQALSHPNIVPVTDVGVDGSECFMTIGYQAGHTLANILPKVREDGGILADALGCGAESRNAARMLFATVRKVDPRHIHAGPQGRFEGRGVVGGRPERGDDLRTAKRIQVHGIKLG